MSYKKREVCTCGSHTRSHKLIGITEIGRWLNCPYCGTTIIEEPIKPQTIADWMMARYMAYNVNYLAFYNPRIQSLAQMPLDRFMRAEISFKLLREVRGSYQGIRAQMRESAR